VSYKVSLTNPAGSDFDNLDPQVKDDILEALRDLDDSPNQKGEPLSGYKQARRIKISPDTTGVYRAAYYVVEDLNEVVIFALGPRENFYELVVRRARRIYKQYFS